MVEGAMMAGPILRWAGGKTKLLPELLARLPATYGRYYEPFVGGGALFFRLRPEHAIIGDVNPDLMTVYRGVAADAVAVARSLRVHERKHSPAYYYRTRSRFNSQRSTWKIATRAATAIYLNRSCFNGIWRVNRRGGFNVPLGRPSGSSLPICEPERLRAAHVLLARTDLRVGDYRETVADSERGDLIYFDCPHSPRSSTAYFTSYTSTGFGDDDQVALAETARQLVARGCYVLLSNSDTPYVRSLYKGFKIDRVKCPRAINSNTSRRGDVDEVIISARSVHSS